MDRLQAAVEKAKKKRAEAERRRPRNDAVDYSATIVQEHSAEELAAKRIVAGISGYAESQVFKLLRTKILSEMRANDWQTIAISSPKYEQGKTTIAANLGVAIAMEMTHSVLLVDLDLQRPNLHEVFELTVEKGLDDVLSRKAKLDEVMINPGIPKLAIIPGHGSIDNSSEKLSDPILLELYKELKSQYRSHYVIYDMPALLHSDDALKTIQNFDCSLLVIEDGKNTADEIRQSVQIMNKTNFLGYLINKSGGAFDLTDSM